MTPAEIWASVLAWGGVAGAGTVWAVRQEGRINGHDDLFEERGNREDERFRMVMDYLKHFDDKLDRLMERMPTQGRDLRH